MSNAFSVNLDLGKGYSIPRPLPTFGAAGGDRWKSFSSPKDLKLPSDYLVPTTTDFAKAFPATNVEQSSTPSTPPPPTSGSTDDEVGFKDSV